MRTSSEGSWVSEFFNAILRGDAPGFSESGCHTPPYKFVFITEPDNECFFGHLRTLFHQSPLRPCNAHDLLGHQEPGLGMERLYSIRLSQVPLQHDIVLSSPGHPREESGNQPMDHQSHRVLLRPGPGLFYRDPGVPEGGDQSRQTLLTVQGAVLHIA